MTVSPGVPHSMKKGSRRTGHYNFTCSITDSVLGKSIGVRAQPGRTEIVKLIARCASILVHTMH